MAEGILGPLPDPIVATRDDLPAPVAAALANPTPPQLLKVPAAGYEFAAREWGEPSARPLLLVHGITSSSNTWWRIGPALAASGRRIVAPDLPGHGQTGGWRGHHRFVETADELIAFVRAVDLVRPGLQVIGHSWGGMISASLPKAGLRPERIVLLDPPALPHAFWVQYVVEPDERRYETLPEALAEVGARNPTWSSGDIHAKAESLTQFDEAAARVVLLENDFDGGLAALADQAAREVPVWYIKGEEAAGSLIPDDWLPRLAARAGADHVLTIRDGEHSPHRQRPEATLVALLRALGD